MPQEQVVNYGSWESPVEAGVVHTMIGVVNEAGTTALRLAFSDSFKGGRTVTPVAQYEGDDLAFDGNGRLTPGVSGHHFTISGRRVEARVTDDEMTARPPEESALAIAKALLQIQQAPGDHAIASDAIPGATLHFRDTPGNSTN
jgi:hypothetical protein